MKQEVTQSVLVKGVLISHLGGGNTHTHTHTPHAWNQMLLMGLLIQNMGRTQKPVKMYHKTVPMDVMTPDFEGSPIIPKNNATREN